MSKAHWVDRLSSYLDGDLSERERTACDAHLAECRDCARTLDDLRALTAQASLLTPIPPERDLWPGIEARLEPRSDGVPAPPEATAPGGVLSIRPTRRWAFSAPQLVAAAIALVVLAGGSVWLIAPSAPDDVADTPTAAAAAAGSDRTVFLATYEPAISELEQEFRVQRDQLDPETRRVVEENMAIIERAIAEAEQALAEDPSNSFLNTHLAGVMRRKVDLLRRATTIQSLET